MTINPDGRRYSEGVTPSGSGYSAEPEPSCTVSAVPVSIPNADCPQCAIYRDIFAEITFKAKPLCRNADDPEWVVTGYELPVGPIHRAAGKIGFQMFNGEAHMMRLMDEMRDLRRRVA